MTWTASRIRVCGGPIAAALLGVAAATSCGRGEPERLDPPPSAGAIDALPGEVHLSPGPPLQRTVTVENPYLGDSQAENEGEQYYTWYNCGGCHGALGGGGMGPPLRDDDWIYGDDAVSIYESIMEGRPEGMPTWRGRIPDDQAWKVVAFIQSLGQRERPPALSPPDDRLPFRTEPEERRTGRP